MKKILLVVLFVGSGCAPAASTPATQKTLFSNYWHCSNSKELALYLGQYGLPFSYTYTGVLNTPTQCVYNLTFNQNGTYDLSKGINKAGCSYDQCIIDSGATPPCAGLPCPCAPITDSWSLQNNTLTFSGNYNSTSWAFSGATCN